MSYDCGCIAKVLTGCELCDERHTVDCWEVCSSVYIEPCKECGAGDICLCHGCIDGYELEHEKGCSLAISKESPLKKQKLSASDDEDDDDASGPIKCKVRGCEESEEVSLCKACDEPICIYHGSVKVGDDDDNVVCNDCARIMCDELGCYAKGIHPCKNCKKAKMCDGHIFTFKTSIGGVGFYCTKCIEKAKKIVETVKNGSLSYTYIKSCCKSKNCSDRIKHWCIICNDGVCVDHATSCDDNGNIICEGCDDEECASSVSETETRTKNHK